MSLPAISNAGAITIRRSHVKVVIKRIVGIHNVCLEVLVAKVKRGVKHGDACGLIAGGQRPRLIETMAFYCATAFRTRVKIDGRLGDSHLIVRVWHRSFYIIDVQ